jgi:hypothetical protein
MKLIMFLINLVIYFLLVFAPLMIIAPLIKNINGWLLIFLVIWFIIISLEVIEKIKIFNKWFLNNIKKNEEIN